uniref:Uncharacterized protein n=1 Tax=Avena sativa TaxID=4498 RepID=A0ACD5WNB1_AVESA
MGEKVATLRMARLELEDLYRAVPDDSVELTFKDLVAPPPRAAVSPAKTLAAIVEDEDNERHSKAALLRSSTNIFTYKVDSDTDRDDDHEHDHGVIYPTSAAGFQLSPSPSPPPAGRRSRSTAIRPSEGTEQQQLRGGNNNVLRRNGGVGNYRRPGIPHSNLCAHCSTYVHILRHRCLACGRVYCRRCVGVGMGDMAEGRKCVDCLGRKYSHRYIHKAGRTTSTAAGLLCSCGLHGWGKGSSALRAEELLWAEKGPAPRRRQPSSSSSTTSISASYSTGAGGGGGYSASMSMTMMSINSGAGGGAGYNSNRVVVKQPASSSFVANSTFSRGAANPHALPL